MTIKSCPICNGNLNIYSRCFDCKHAIQWVCYKCQWESNLRNHMGCHKNVSSLNVSKTNLQKPKFPVIDVLKYKTDELYHTPMQVIAPVFNLIH